MLLPLREWNITEAKRHKSRLEGFVEFAPVIACEYEGIYGCVDSCFKLGLQLLWYLIGFVDKNGFAVRPGKGDPTRKLIPVNDPEGLPR